MILPRITLPWDANRNMMLRKIFLSLCLSSSIAGTASFAAEEPPHLTAEEFENANKLYFERCAGCHGVLRQGATGKPLTPDITRTLGTEFLKMMIQFGSPAGMPAFGQSGELSETEVDILAKYIQHDPPQPPQWGENEIRASWRVIIPIENRVKQKENAIDLDDLFVVTLRDTGEIALIDGASKAIVTILKTGYAVHISRFSASGRYLYTIGRDGKLTLVDLWMAVPAVVAEVRIGLEARSVETSKAPGFQDRYAAAGAYWPSHLAIVDGQTLELKSVVPTTTAMPGQPPVEDRVAAIVGSHSKSEFIVNVKESGKVLFVDYGNVDAPSVKKIDVVPFLHDGGLDQSKRYFLSVANQSNKIAVIDTQKAELTAVIDVDRLPHPGRGANFVDPQFGPVWATPHLGAGTISLIGTDPQGHPEAAWKVVRQLEGQGSGSLFIKTHPKSHNLWIDTPFNPEPAKSQSAVVFDIRDLTKGFEVVEIAKMTGIGDGPLRVVHPEYNKDGTEVWFSVWNTKTNKSAIVIVDDATRQLKHVIADERLITPTGKFNSFNTRNDVY